MLLHRVRDLMRGVTQAAPGHEEPNPPPPYPASADPHLPPGWEARTDEATKKTFYIDHTTKVAAQRCPVCGACRASADQPGLGGGTSTPWASWVLSSMGASS